MFAAASLREAFGVVGQELEAARPGLHIAFNFAGSQELRAQIEQGADADVFASADQKPMAALAATHAVLEPALFARNEPVLVIAKAQAGKLAKLADLPNASRIAIGAPDVPIGRYTAQILAHASASALGADFEKHVRAHVVSEELNVKQVLAKVSLGEVDAGIVYRSDANAAGDGVVVVPIPSELNVIAQYVIAVVARSKQADLARVFVAAAQAPNGRAALAKVGFLAAEANRADLGAASPKP